MSALARTQVISSCAYGTRLGRSGQRDTRLEVGFGIATGVSQSISCSAPQNF